MDTCTKASPGHFSTSNAIVAATSSVFLRDRSDISINTGYIAVDNILISCCLVSHLLDSSFVFFRVAIHRCLRAFPTVKLHLTFLYLRLTFHFIFNDKYKRECCNDWNIELKFISDRRTSTVFLICWSVLIIKCLPLRLIFIFFSLLK